MFSSKQIDFMKSLGLDFDFKNLSDEEYIEIGERVADELEYRGFDEEYEPTEIGKMCESILDKLSEDDE